MKKPSWIEKLLCILPFICFVNAGCKNITIHDVQCTCTKQIQDLEVTGEHTTRFINASTIEITKCRNVTLRANLFRRAYNLHMLSFSEIDNLSIDPALSLPHSLTVLKFSRIRFLDHFPVPGPNSAVLQSLAHLESFILENVTVSAPMLDSTFIDLSIAEVDLKSVQFIGTLPKGALEFNGKAMIKFNAFKCQFDKMNESSFLVEAKENVTIKNCEFGEVMPGSMKVFGQHVSLDGNSFRRLSGSNSISIKGNKYISVSGNKIESLGDSHALVLDAEDDARVYFKNNTIPCGCYAENLIRSLIRKVNTSTCEPEDSPACVLLQKHNCLHSNGNKDKIQISKSDMPHCPASGASSLINNKIYRFPLYLIASCLTYNFLL